MKKLFTLLTVSAMLASCSTAYYGNRTYRVKRDNQRVAEKSDERNDVVQKETKTAAVKESVEKKNHVTITVRSKEECEQTHAVAQSTDGQENQDLTVTASNDDQPVNLDVDRFTTTSSTSTEKRTITKKELRKKLMKPVRKMTKAQKKITKAINAPDSTNDLDGLLYVFLVVLLVLLILSFIAELLPLVGNLIVLALLIALLIVVLT
jgi:Flp pilus assembly protein TadB